MKNQRTFAEKSKNFCKNQKTFAKISKLDFKTEKNQWRKLKKHDENLKIKNH